MKAKLKKELLFEFIIFALGVFFIVIFWKNNILLASLLLILYLSVDRFWHKKHNHIFFITGSILGPVCEIIATRYNVWIYSNPTFLNIPLWLPFAWGLSAVLIIRISETFLKIEKR